MGSPKRKKLTVTGNPIPKRGKKKKVFGGGEAVPETKSFFS